MKTFDKMKVLRIQSISDIITNSSSEVFICSYDPDLPSGESYSMKITVDRVINSWIKDFIYGDYLGIPNILEDYQVDLDEPEKHCKEWSDKFEKYVVSEDMTNQDCLDLLEEYGKEHPKLGELLEERHYIVFLSDHDKDYDCYRPYGYPLGRY